MAQIDFYANSFAVTNLTTSGLGFYGAGFGNSVPVGSYNSTTFITDANGTVEGSQVNNVKYIHPSSGQVNGGGDVLVNTIPNYLATLNIRFTHSSTVLAENVELRIYDRINTNNDPSGVTCQVAELIQTDNVYTTGSGDSTWTDVHGSGVTLTLADSPGISGLYAGGGGLSSQRHDWFTILSPSPDSIGSKTFFGLSVSLSYL